MFQFNFQQEDFGRHVKIYCLEKSGNTIHALSYSEGTLTRKEVPEFGPLNESEYPPYVVLSTTMLQEFAEELKIFMLRSGIPDKSETYIKGKLEATERQVQCLEAIVHKLVDASAGVAIAPISSRSGTLATKP